jgi:hypothetical protein
VAAFSAVPLFFMAAESVIDRSGPIGVFRRLM